jgi:hypothetical protein
MSTKSRQTIYGGRLLYAQIRAESAREAAKKAIRAAAERPIQSLIGEAGSSNCWNATTIGTQSSQRKNPASVSAVAGAVW